MNGPPRLGFLGLVDFLGLAMVLGGVPWFECCWSSYLKEYWIARLCGVLLAAIIIPAPGDAQSLWSRK